jgi:hypothetical protein
MGFSPKCLSLLGCLGYLSQLSYLGLSGLSGLFRLSGLFGLLREQEKPEGLKELDKLKSGGLSIRAI